MLNTLWLDTYKDEFFIYREDYECSPPERFIRICSPPERFVRIDRGSEFYIEHWKAITSQNVIINRVDVPFTPDEYKNVEIITWRQKEVQEQRDCEFLQLKALTVPTNVFDEYLRTYEDSL